ncbi:LOW QUALITY PROTEIN: Hypothetical protein PHPALM_14401 [Phytophthora palmivora]|uniref:Uncharacterized protein n=1 Tax=Phytophthora palmivora TaxID=4796 RepID=A0A2P4XUV4_9STRA|nr:LOW QUALITY PROTEIN: Hypothetical protein PHPALM_14401 [Phytophthora palmivora]
MLEVAELGDSREIQQSQRVYQASAEHDPSLQSLLVHISFISGFPVDLTVIADTLAVHVRKSVGLAARFKVFRRHTEPNGDGILTVEAGFTVRSVKSNVNGWVAWNVQIVQGTEISLHNHKTNQVIYDSYRGANRDSLLLKSVVN